MTKLKNTKKGMAKKALSISLVAAMLATSNVPVWAAEDIFSDNNAAVEAEAPVDDVDVFSSEEAPVAAVVEEVDSTDVLQANANYTVSKNAVLTTTTNGQWDGFITLLSPNTDDLAYKITDVNGEAVKKVTVEAYVEGSLYDTYTAESDTDDLSSAINDEIKKIKKKKEAFLKNQPTIELRIYGGTDTLVAPVDTMSFEMKAVDITGKTLTDLTQGDKAYSGTQKEITGAKISASAYAEATLSNGDIMVNYVDANGGINVGKYDVYAEGTGAFTGRSAILEKAVEVEPVEASAKNMSIVVSGDGVYTGSAVLPSSVVVTDKLTNKVIPSDFYTVETTNTDMATYSSSTTTVTATQKTLGVVVKMKDDNSDSEDPDKTVVDNNFKDPTGGNGVPSGIITGAYSITALDLATLKNKYDFSVKDKKVDAAVSMDDITIIDKATGKEIEDYTTIMPQVKTSAEANCLSIATTNNIVAGTGTVTITPYAGSTYVTGKLELNFRVANAVVQKTNIYLPKGTVVDASTTLERPTQINEELNGKIEAAMAVTYDGTAQEPLKDMLSNIYDVNGRKYVLDTDYTIDYKNNKDSDEVKGSTKKAKAVLTFKDQYSGTVEFEFAIGKADVEVEGKKIAYETGKSSYNAVVEVVTKDAKGADVIVSPENYTVEYTQKATSTTAPNNVAKATVTMKNKNYNVTNDDVKSVDGFQVIDVESTLEGKSLTDTSIGASVVGEYVYTGKAINPQLDIKDGSYALVEGTDYTVKSKAGVAAGEASITIEGKGNYSGTLTLKYTVKKANIADATVDSGRGTGKETNYDDQYTGSVVKPMFAKTNGKTTGIKFGDVVLDESDDNGKTGDYILEIGDNKDIGTYTFKLIALPSSDKVEGTYEGTYRITPRTDLAASFAKINTTAAVTDLGTLAYTGKEITLADLKTKYVVLCNDKKLTEGKDYKLVYEGNTDAGTATVKIYGLGNYAVVDDNGSEKELGSGTFIIKGLGVITSASIGKISDAEYAGGLYVEPKVEVKLAGKTLVQGVDYVVSTKEVNVGEKAGNLVFITGKGAYIANTTANATVNGEVSAAADSAHKWNVTKKDLANTTITVDGDNVTVFNGNVVVPSSEYDVTFNEDNTKVTVAAKATSKNYTGSQEKSTDSKAVGTPVIKEVKVTNNKANIILSGDVDNAIGYDYVVSTVEDYKNGRVAFDKNQPATQSTIQYLQKGEYYAYLHAWKRVDGKKVFGGWSNIVKFTVTTTTPDQPLVTSVTRSGSTVKVTYTKTKNATGYDIVLGNKTKKVNGELRPVEYGKLVKKITKGNVVTATFKNVPKGTYYAGLHAYNRTSVNNSKVFSPWSNSKKVVVK